VYVCVFVPVIAFFSSKKSFIGWSKVPKVYSNFHNNLEKY